jgi:NitT/TauT family transport system permease protein
MIRLRRWTALLVCLGLWEAASRAELVDPFNFPPPSAVGLALVELFSSPAIWAHMEATFGAALAGLLFGTVAGITLGFAAALSRYVGELLEPAMAALNAVPRVVLAPLFVIWLGIGVTSKVAVSLLLVSVLMFFATFQGVRQVDRRLVERVRSFGGGRRWLLQEVYAPSVATWVLGNLKVAVGFAFTGAVVGEFVASYRGIGYLLGFAQSQYNAPLVLGLIALVMVVVLALLALAGRVEARLLAWQNPRSDDEDAPARAGRPRARVAQS